MNTNYPERPESHQLEEASHRFFTQQLPRSWVCEKPAHDYGVDLRVEMFENNAATGLELLVQLKASARSSTGETESLVLRATTFNMLRNKLQVVMLVKYSEEDGEAYWQLLRDAREPGQENDSVTIRIPKENQLSKIDWHEILLIVRGVTEVKLAANRM